MTEAHHGRAHAQWAASATSRNIVCPGAIAMSTMCEDRESEAAAWGSCAHQISERCLTSSIDANEYLGGVEKHGKFEFPVDEEMVACAQEYVDHVRADAATATWLKIEQRFSLAALDPPMEAGGTGDAILYYAGHKHLKVKDLKGGRGVVVEVKGNAQMRTYALCALLAYPDIDVETIEITIIQPRASHKDGRIRSETFHVADLLDWTHDLLGAMRLSKTALDEFEKLGGNRVLFDEWAEKYLKTGQCTFCSAKAICPKVRAEALATAGEAAAKWFEEPSEGQPQTNAPSLASPEELGHWLDGFETLEGWIKAVRAHAHAMAEQGASIPGYQLAEKIGNRAWMLKDQGDLCDELQVALNLTGNDILEVPVVKSVAQIEKTLGSKRKAEFAKLEGKLWNRPVRGTNLVSAGKTERPPAPSKPEAFFEKL